MNSCLRWLVLLLVSLALANAAAGAVVYQNDMNQPYPSSPYPEYLIDINGDRSLKSVEVSQLDWQNNQPSLIYLSIQLGGIVILAFYNMFLFLSLRMRLYFYYVAYLFAFVLGQWILTGLADYTLPNSSFKVWLLEEGRNFLGKFAGIFACYFTYQFLNLRLYSPRMGRIVIWLSRILWLSLLVTQWGTYSWDSVFILPALIIVCALILVCGIQASMRGYRPAYYFTLAWTALLVGVIIVNLKNYGFLPVNIFTSWASVTGGTIESILLSFALWAYFNETQLSTERQRENYIEQLVANEKAKRQSNEQLEKMIYPHQLAMIRRGATLESTMPTGSGLAFVLAMDTVASSNLEGRLLRHFLSEVFRKCYDQMLVGYSTDVLQAQAYRIKEMGEGFMCSIGYPFPVPGPKNPAEVAFELALRFSQIFASTAKQFTFRVPPVCSLALSFGEVESFYPQAGVIEYAMCGRGIELANRYEGLRNILFPKGLAESLLVLQNDVYEQLASHHQAQLRSFDLQEIDLRIRDDDQAQCFYYGYLNEGRVLSKRLIPDRFAG